MSTTICDPPILDDPLYAITIVAAAIVADFPYRDADKRSVGSTVLLTAETVPNERLLSQLAEADVL